MSKKLDFFAITKKSFEITRENKFLWWFGFFITLGGGIYLSYSYGDSAGEGEEIDEMYYIGFVRKIYFYWENYTEWIIIGIILFILSGIFFYFWGLVNKLALIDAIFKIEQCQSIGFKSGIREGFKHLGRIFLLHLVIFLIFSILLLILLLPVVRLFLLKSYVAGSLLALVALIIIISFSFLLQLIRKYAEIYLVVGKLGPIKVFGLAYNLVEKNLAQTILAGLLSIAWNIFGGIVATIVFWILMGPFLIGGVLVEIFWDKVSWDAPAFIAVILAIGLLILLNSVYNVFIQSFWISVFEGLASAEDNEKKSEEIIEEKEEFRTGLKEKVTGEINNI